MIVGEGRRVCIDVYMSAEVLLSSSMTHLEISQPHTKGVYQGQTVRLVLRLRLTSLLLCSCVMLPLTAATWR